MSGDRFEELAREWENGGFMRETHAAFLRRVAEEAWDQGHICGREKAAGAKENRELRDRLEQSESELSAAREETHEIRYALWCMCPHDGKYGDDGEMQCRGADFKRQPLMDLIHHLVSALQAWSTAAREQVRRLRERISEAAGEELPEEFFDKVNDITPMDAAQLGYAAAIIRVSAALAETGQPEHDYRMQTEEGK